MARKITACDEQLNEYQITDTIKTDRNNNPDSYYIIGIYVSNSGGPIFAVQSDNEAEAIEELASSKYGHFILIEDAEDLAEYEELGVVHWTDAGPCYIQEPIAFISRLKTWDEFAARDLALQNLPDRIMIDIEEDRMGNYAITVSNKQERKWIKATNLHDHSATVYLTTQEEVRSFVDAFDRSCSEESDDGYISLIGGWYSIDTWLYRHLVGGQSD